MLKMYNIYICDQMKEEQQQDLCEDQVARSSRSNSSDSAESKR